MHALTVVTAVVLKIATLAPEGTTWMKQFRKLQERVEQRTERRVTFKFFSGGVQGDERDVLRKMRAGQLSGAAVTGIGLSMIDPEVRALEAARTYGELDHARERLGPLLKKKFEERGYILMGWGDVGPVHVFSKRPIKSLADLRQTKLWMWSDDPITRQIFAALELHGIPLGVPEVLPALATGSVDAFMGSPLSTVALQWASHARYVTSAVVGMATGATVLSKKAWDEISPGDRAIIVEEGQKLERAAESELRHENVAAMEAMKKKGLQEVPTPLEMTRDVARRTMSIAEKTAAGFSKEFQGEVMKLLEEYRRAHPEEL
jgi:TRAP-type C4-dicarboxylate transport system substrate-binding protein